MREVEVQSFDTHKSIKKIQGTGLKENQAEAIVDILRESRNFDLDRLATKDQLENTEARLGSKIHAMEVSIIKWNIGTIIAIAALFAAYLQFFGR